MATGALPQRVTSMPVLANEILSAVARRGCVPTRRSVSKGDLISLQDGRGAAVHVLAHGRVKVLRFSDEGRVILLDLVEVGELFGEMSFLSGDLHPALSQSYAEALEITELISIPRLTFERLLSGRPSLALRVAGLLAERCSRLEERLESQVFHRVPTRLAKQLLELARRYGETRGSGTVISLNLSQQDLGNLIGASREIVSLTITDFKRRGWVTSVGRRLVVHEDKLRESLSRACLSRSK